MGRKKGGEKVTKDERRIAQKEVLQRLLLFILWNDQRDLEEVKRLIILMIAQL